MFAHCVFCQTKSKMWHYEKLITLPTLRHENPHKWHLRHLFFLLPQLRCRFWSLRIWQCYLFMPWQLLTPLVLAAIQSTLHSWVWNVFIYWWLNLIGLYFDMAKHVLHYAEKENALFLYTLQVEVGSFEERMTIWISSLSSGLKF